LKNKTKMFFITNLILFIISVLIYTFCIFYEPFAEFYSRTVSSALRIVMAKLTGLIPFSLAEIFVVIGIPVLLIYLVYIIISSFKHKENKLSKHIKILSGIAMLAAVIYINNFGVCYHRHSLEYNLGLQRNKISKEQLYEGALSVSRQLERASLVAKFDEDGASVMPYTFFELSNKLDDAYDSFISEYNFITDIKTPAKHVLLSEYMTYAHISGIYMPLTGEANVNTNYPDYVVVFSMAHEKAHQRGIAGEDEANFVAYLACMSSDDEYIRYAALMSMYDYYLTAAMQADYNMYTQLISQSGEKVLGEMHSYYEFFEKYRSSKAAKVAESVNDTYLKIQGQDEGTQSYGLVVELAEAYRLKKEALQ